MPTPVCSLRVLRPTPTTVSFTVSTREPLDSIAARILHPAILLVRLLLVFEILIVLWVEWDLLFGPATSYQVPVWLTNSPVGWEATSLVTAVPGQYLVPVLLVCVWILIQRGYTGMLTARIASH